MPIISFGAPCERLSAHQRIHPLSQRIQVRNLCLLYTSDAADE